MKEKKEKYEGKQLDGMDGGFVNISLPMTWLAVTARGWGIGTLLIHTPLPLRRVLTIVVMIYRGDTHMGPCVDWDVSFRSIRCFVELLVSVGYRKTLV